MILSERGTIENKFDFDFMRKIYISITKIYLNFKIRPQLLLNSFLLWKKTTCRRNLVVRLHGLEVQLCSTENFLCKINHQLIKSPGLISGWVKNHILLLYFPNMWYYPASKNLFHLIFIYIFFYILYELLQKKNRRDMLVRNSCYLKLAFTNIDPCNKDMCLVIQNWINKSIPQKCIQKSNFIWISLAQKNHILRSG